MQSDKPHDQSLKLVGTLTVALSNVDSACQSLFVTLTKLDVDLGAAIYLSFRDASQRRKLLKEVASVVLKDEEQKTRFKEVHDEHADLYSRRNELMHRLWIYDPFNEGFVVMQPLIPGRSYNEQKVITAADNETLTKLVQRTQQLYRSIWSLIDAIAPPTIIEAKS
jgi:hypothetical protein